MNARILSDLHYGDRASRLRTLTALRPLADEADALVFNGDTLDTRWGPRPEHTAACRAEVAAFAREHGEPVTFLSGNHDPDIAPRHWLELAGGRVLVTHGDIVFEDIVPWGRDAPFIRKKIAAALAELPPSAHAPIETRFAVWRRIAAAIPQRHQSEPHGFKYALRFAADTVWPPLRIARILRAWREQPVRMAALAREHWPAARFIVIGHTHRPGIWPRADGVTVINTGSFCPPLGGYAVDVSDTQLRVRRIVPRNGAFRADAVIAEWPIA